MAKKSISTDALLHHKALTPLSDLATAELLKIQQLEVKGFSEAEVRAYVIDPIVRLLGYAKGSRFSPELEKKLDFIDKDKFFDYRLSLWYGNFWVIEAKKPRSKKHFGYSDFKQALEYAIHPEINAALVVLCDGNKIEVFDREVSVTEPMLRVERKFLVRDFDKIRQILEPLQIWFFEKRRISRMLDKVFAREFNMGRIEEFRELVDRQLNLKRSGILENSRREFSSKSSNADLVNYLKEADLSDLVDINFFSQFDAISTRTMINRLVSLCEANTFPVLYKIFPDYPRDINHTYSAHSLMFLLALHESKASVGWLPGWLCAQPSENNVTRAIERLIALCLTHFREDGARNIILLSAASIRRIYKLLCITRTEQWNIAELQHIFFRYTEPEFSWTQIVASPGRQILFQIDAATVFGVTQFVKGAKSSRGEFQPETAKLRLRDLWKFERKILANTNNYRTLAKERDLGELHPTELVDVTYDFLGHFTLCLVDYFPAWKDYVLNNHRAEVQAIAALGSWKAKEWLGLKVDEQVPGMNTQDIANRFFFGDTQTLDALIKGYR
ncbi:MAG: hypothetical protein AB7T07_13520 [Steroidobacteraceae bacterium]